MRRGLPDVTLECAHADINVVGKQHKPVIVRINSANQFECVELFGGELWTFRNGKKNSFPFMEVPALLELDDDVRRKFAAADRKTLLREASKGKLNKKLSDWPGRGLLESLEKRFNELAGIPKKCAAVPDLIERFLEIFGRNVELREQFFKRLLTAIAMEAENGSDEWLKIARAIAIGKEEKGKVVGGVVYFDVPAKEYPRDVHDIKNRSDVARFLLQCSNGAVGRCAVTGHDVQLHKGNFPSPNLPALGQSFIFSKNPDLAAVSCYGRSGDSAFPLGRDRASELAGALNYLVDDNHKNVTWCKIPGEKPKTSDLLVAFVDGQPCAPVAGLLGDTEDYEDQPDPSAIYELQTTRLIQALNGVAQPLNELAVHAFVFRKVDEGNKKAIFHRRLTVHDLKESASRWTEALGNCPPWLRRSFDKQKYRRRFVTPFSIPGLTRQQYIRTGTETTDAVGVSSNEALSLFLNEGDSGRRAQRILRVALKRLRLLLEAWGHGLHGQERIQIKTVEALDAAQLLSALLFYLEKVGDGLLNDSAFLLGQLLSIADVMHAGYCADVRKGESPNKLLGNTILPVAQKNPAKALAIMGRRWKIYSAWAQRASVDPKREDRLALKIRRAISQHRRAAELCRALHNGLPTHSDDVFAAELLLGYVAGLPPKKASQQNKDWGKDEPIGITL